MILFYNELTKIIFSLFLAVIILFLSFRLSTHNPDTEKVSAYEWGFELIFFSWGIFLE
jgi:NADH:ubiquinone oxidoreductase subunit 3 (subunit A)